MMHSRTWLVGLGVAAMLTGAEIAVESGAGMQPLKGKAEAATYKGRKALKVMDSEGAQGEDRLVLLTGTSFQNGTIEASIAGEPGKGAGEGARGFVGIAFRVAPEASKFECFYLRPTNGRAEDQVRRNHSAQYFSFPEFPWYRLRKEFPEKYETYVDLAPGEWTPVKIEVRGTTARLFVHGASQPAMVVNDLKLGDSKGAIALWIGPGTVAHFAGVRVSE
jgi:hypothetical protein